ncbi:LysR family transcriptional regulator [Caballeronia arationis]|uniref:DNA-binding transcriptional regulator, LysR family n=1 Tax=Caballeronia arationis TaxID=1777142 RepID=A0A7Z7IDT3_9BURK|nr:LysR family transcriptional regulator [Caballeronia arationis]SAL01573.1 LysR family transcriptional regulator [Caballeronia arationis]SOE88891.1 DNA-binding transcriptional regulator, LysR family [Caballeronia arationis]
MELRHLRYFAAVAECGSFRLAAERISLTQPAITRQIHDLEDTLGVRLFDRSPQGVKLTAEGALFLEEVRKVLGMLESAVRSVKLVASGLRGTLRVGVVENASWDGIVPDAFSLFQREAREVAIHVAPMNTPEQFAALVDGTLDGGFVYTWGELPRGLSVMPLALGDVVAAVPRDWDWPAGDTIAARELNGRPLVCFPRQTYPAYHDTLVAACHAAGLTLNVVQEVPTEAAILSLVSAGVGAAIVNAANLGRPPARARFLRFEDLSVGMPLAFAYVASNPNAALQRLLRVLESMPRA